MTQTFNNEQYKTEFPFSMQILIHELLNDKLKLNTLHKRACKAKRIGDEQTYIDLRMAAAYYSAVQRIEEDKQKDISNEL